MLGPDSRAGLFVWPIVRLERLKEVRERFRRMVELGRADENDDYIIFRWEW